LCIIFYMADVKELLVTSHKKTMQITREMTPNHSSPIIKPLGIYYSQLQATVWSPVPVKHRRSFVYEKTGLGPCGLKNFTIPSEMPVYQPCWLPSLAPWLLHSIKRMKTTWRLEKCAKPGAKGKIRPLRKIPCNSWAADRKKKFHGSSELFLDRSVTICNSLTSWKTFMYVWYTVWTPCKNSVTTLRRSFS